MTLTRFIPKEIYPQGHAEINLNRQYYEREQLIYSQVAVHFRRN